MIDYHELVGKAHIENSHKFYGFCTFTGGNFYVGFKYNISNFFFKRSVILKYLYTNNCPCGCGNIGEIPLIIGNN